MTHISFWLFLNIVSLLILKMKLTDVQYDSFLQKGK